MTAISQMMTVNDMPSMGLKLFRHGEASFASTLSADRSPSVDSLLPYTVVISNETNDYVVAYSIRWKCIAADGNVVIQESTIFNQATLHVLEAHSCQVASAVSGIGSWSNNEPSIRMQDAQRINRSVAFYQKQKNIEVSLEAIIFSDGKTVGNDTGFWVPRIKAWVDAERDLAHQVQVSSAVDLRPLLIQIKDEAMAALATPELKQIGLALAANRSLSYNRAYVFAKGDFATQMLESVETNGAEQALDFARELSARKAWPNIHSRTG